MKLKLNTRTQQFSELINKTDISSDKATPYAPEDGITAITQLLLNCHTAQGITYVIGNGGSSAIAGHAVIDLLNSASIRATTLHDAATLTCISNDYGYEQVYEQQIKMLLRQNDVLIAISSSGRSQNILKAVQAAKQNTAKVITLSGFAADNPLRRAGDINIWLDSCDYGLVEIGHSFILHNITDRLNAREGRQ